LELRCTKTYGAHWGIFYKEGQVYQVIEETTYERTLIINEKEIRANLPYYTIGGEGREKHSFISISKNEIIQKFGSCKFDTTEKMAGFQLLRIAEDYFDMIPIYRERKLNQLL